MNSKLLIDKLVPTIFEDDDLLVVTKPAGVDVGDSSGGPSVGLIQLLVEVRGRMEGFEPVNRLSRYESGLLILGKTPAIARQLRSILRSGRLPQEYQAVVIGKPRQPRIMIKPPREKAPAQPRRTKRGRPEPPPNGPPPTTIQLVRQSTRRALVQCKTSVGTTHGLRAQLRAVRLRLVGDRLNDRSAKSQHAQHTCLHLSKVTFLHPVTKTMRTLRSRAPATFDVTTDGGHGVERELHAGLTRRLPCVTNSECDAYRLLTGDVEGIKGLVAEKYGSVGVLQVHGSHTALMESLRTIAEWYQKMLGLRAVYVKHFVRNRLDPDESLSASLDDSKPLVGRPVAKEIPIVENGLTFGIRPYAGFSLGLFLDHRENRGRVRSMSDGKDVLNLFAYTCGFSVAAAAGGANSTVSVDISPGNLDWGKANFARNSLEAGDHQFIRSDAAAYLERAHRQSKRFDLIVVDPPTFAHGRRRKQSFSVARDLTHLIAASIDVLRPGGVMMLSTSYRKLSIQDLRKRAQAGARGRRFKVIATPALPIDYAMDRDHAKTAFLQFE